MSLLRTCDELHLVINTVGSLSSSKSRTLKYLSLIVITPSPTSRSALGYRWEGLVENRGSFKNRSGRVILQMTFLARSNRSTKRSSSERFVASSCHLPIRRQSKMEVEVLSFKSEACSYCATHSNSSFLQVLRAETVLLCSAPPGLRIATTSPIVSPDISRKAYMHLC